MQRVGACKTDHLPRKLVVKDRSDSRPYIYDLKEYAMTATIRRLLIAFAFAGLMMKAGAAYGLIRFVSTHGVDSGDCTTSPCRTIQFAVDVADPGDTIFVKPGNYHENLLITTSSLTLMGAGASTTIITGDGTSNVVYVFGVTSFRIERFSVLNAGKSGTLPGSAAIHLNPDSATAVGNWVVSRNILSESGFGLVLWNSLGGGTALIENNLIDSNTFDGIKNDGHPHIILLNNTIANNGWFGYSEFVGAANNFVVNNIVTGNGFSLGCPPCAPTGIVVGPAGTYTISFNDAFNNVDGDYGQNTGSGFIPYVPSPGTGDISADPMFFDVNAGNYRLIIDSPAIDTGTNAHAPRRDLDGILRPQDGDSDGIVIVDMGAFERPPEN
jgi:hypothetical protein